MNSSEVAKKQSMFVTQVLKPHHYSALPSWLHDHEVVLAFKIKFPQFNSLITTTYMI